MEQKNVKISVSEGAEFFSHETAINFNPLQFILDFKSLTPRIDMRNKDGPIIVVRHNVVLVDPYHAKQIMTLMQNSIKRYEEEFGEIKRPKILEKAERKMQKQSKSKPKKQGSPSYFG